MRYLQKFEDYTGLEFVAPVREHPSYKNEEKNKKRKKKGQQIEPYMTPPNHTKDVISFHRTS